VQAIGVDGVEHLRGMELISVGPITSQALREVGLPVTHEAREHSEGGVVEVFRGRA
jgi:uroporphyrinogen-III synthase